MEIAVGKWGRVNSALDPAPVQMFENTINYKPEYILDENGQRQKFKINHEGDFVLNLPEVRKTIEINGNKKETDRNRVEIEGIKEVTYNKGNESFMVQLEDKKLMVEKPFTLNSSNFNQFHFISSDFNLFQSISNNFQQFLIHDQNGEYFRQWRPQIKKPDDIWNEIVKVTNIPGLTSAPKIATYRNQVGDAFNRNACANGT